MQFSLTYLFFKCNYSDIWNIWMFLQSKICGEFPVHLFKGVLSGMEYFLSAYTDIMNMIVKTETNIGEKSIQLQWCRLYFLANKLLPQIKTKVNYYSTSVLLIFSLSFFFLFATRISALVQFIWQNSVLTIISNYRSLLERVDGESFSP